MIWTLFGLQVFWPHFGFPESKWLVSLDISEAAGRQSQCPDDSAEQRFSSRRDLTLRAAKTRLRTWTWRLNGWYWKAGGCASRARQTFWMLIGIGCQMSENHQPDIYFNGLLWPSELTYGRLHAVSTGNSLTLLERRESWIGLWQGLILYVHSFTILCIIYHYHYYFHHYYYFHFYDYHDYFYHYY